MKKILPLFLFLLPCLAWAQYPSNGNQKITLGEQTTADGLIYRGVAADTTLTAKSDTAAYFVLDTVNKKLYFYKVSAIPKWNEISGSGGGGSGTVTSVTGGTGLTGGTITTSGTLAADTSFLFTQSDTLSLNLTSRFAAKQNNLTLTTTGTSGAATLDGATLNIPQYSGGVDSTAIKYVNTYGTQTVNGAKTFTSVVTGTRFNPTSSTVTGNGMYLPLTNSLGFSTNGTQRIHVNSAGKVGFGTQMTTAGTNDYGLVNVNGKFTAETELNVLRSNGIQDGGYFTFTMRDSGDIGSFNTGLKGILEFKTYSDNNSIGAIVIGTFNANPIILATSNSEKFRLTSDGNVGIGTTSPLALLNVMGTVRINSASAPDANYYLQLENSSSQKAKANAWDTYSDSRIKTNRQPIINAIDKINLLNPTYYNQHDSYVEDDLLNIDYNNSYKSLGFIAQEVYEVIPEAVNMGTTNELWAMDYTKLIPILTKAIQEQQALIKALEQRIINLENK